MSNPNNPDWTDNQLDKEITGVEVELEALHEHLLDLQDERFRRYWMRLIQVDISPEE